MSNKNKEQIDEAEDVMYDDLDECFAAAEEFLRTHPNNPFNLTPIIPEGETMPLDEYNVHFDKWLKELCRGDKK